MKETKLILIILVASSIIFTLLVEFEYDFIISGGIFLPYIWITNNKFKTHISFLYIVYIILWYFNYNFYILYVINIINRIIKNYNKYAFAMQGSKDEEGKEEKYYKKSKHKDHFCNSENFMFGLSSHPNYMSKHFFDDKRTADYSRSVDRDRYAEENWYGSKQMSNDVKTMLKSAVGAGVMRAAINPSVEAIAKSAVTGAIMSGAKKEAMESLKEKWDESNFGWFKNKSQTING